MALQDSTVSEVTRIRSGLFSFDALRQSHRLPFEAGATLAVVLALALMVGTAQEALGRGHGLGSPLRGTVAGRPHRKPELPAAKATTQADREAIAARAYAADELSRLRPAGRLTYTPLPVDALGFCDDPPLILPPGWCAYRVTWDDCGDDEVVVLRRTPLGGGAR